jgi:hypothetical protein
VRSNDNGELAKIFFGRDADARHSGKWEHYFEIYERHLSRFRGQPLTLLEIGVQNGGSIDVYRQFFGEQLQYVGIDIDPACRQLERHYASGVRIEIGDSSDSAFLARVASRLPKIDVIIDDGSHVPLHQLRAFSSLYGRLDVNGVYVVEDLHTNYFPSYGGGRRSPSTFLAYAKELTDSLHDHVYQNPYYHPRLTTRIDRLLFRLKQRLHVPGTGSAPVPWTQNLPHDHHRAFRETTKSIHFYPYVVVFEKGRWSSIRETASGSQMLPHPPG